jgi:hypothetical protein
MPHVGLCISETVNIIGKIKGADAGLVKPETQAAVLLQT